MTLEAATLALRAELQAPTVLTRADFRAASKIQRPVINRVSQQASVLQQILVGVEEDETNEAVQGKLESLRQTLRALQRNHDKAERAYATLSQAVKQFTDEAADIVATITREE